MAAAPLFIAGAFLEPFLAIGVLYCAVLTLCMAVDAILLPRRRCLSVRRIAPERVSLGVPTRIGLEVRTALRRRVRVGLAEDLPENLEARPAQCWGTFDAGAAGTLEYRLVGQQRGHYVLTHLDVRVLPAGGLFYRQFRLPLHTDIHVYPNLANLKRYELLVRRGQALEGQARLRQIGQGTEFESLRTYAPGDDMARVDWKATARHSRLIIRNCQPERQQSILVAIDVGRATAGEFGGFSRLDYFVNAALMLAYVALRQGDWFSLVAFSNRIESYLPPVRQAKNIDRVARALYRLEPRLDESDYGSACRFLGLKSRKRSLVCLMTDIIDREASDVIIAYLARFARYHLPLAVTLADPEVLRLAEEPLVETADPYSKAVAIDVLTAREEALTAMRRHGVSVLEAHPRALTPDLINRYLAIKSARRL